MDVKQKKRIRGLLIVIAVCAWLASACWLVHAWKVQRDVQRCLAQMSNRNRDSRAYRWAAQAELIRIGKPAVPGLVKLLYKGVV